MIKFKLLALLLLLSICQIASSQNYKAKVQLGFWSDTIQYPELAPIIRLYINYLESNPDSIYDNPYWNEQEKEKYEDFDISRNSLFQGGKGTWTAKRFYTYFTAHILSVQKKDSVYKIKVMFYRPEKDANSQKLAPFNPPVIQRYYAIMDKGKWKLANAYSYDLKNWHRRETKYINYHFPRKSMFSEELAEKSNRFCDSIICRFDFPPLEKKIEYYVCNGEFEVGEILGYDYYIYGWALGKTIQDKIISGNGTVYYPHELVHFIDDDPTNRGRNITEGFATWLGGSAGKSFPKLASIFAKEYLAVDTASFTWAWDSKLNKYALGALIIDMVFDEVGDKGVLEFMKMPNKNAEETRNSIQEICGWSRQKFSKKWNQKLEEFLANP